MAVVCKVTPAEKLELARAQLVRALDAWDPPDWADLSHYGFHALENALDAACLHLGIGMTANHRVRQEAAHSMHLEHGMDDVSELLGDLNETRKSESYGDVVAPELDAEETVNRIAAYVEAVEALVGGQ